MQKRRPHKRPHADTIPPQKRLRDLAYEPTSSDTPTPFGVYLPVTEGHDSIAKAAVLLAGMTGRSRPLLKVPGVIMSPREIPVTRNAAANGRRIKALRQYLGSGPEATTLNRATRGLWLGRLHTIPSPYELGSPRLVLAAELVGIQPSPPRMLRRLATLALDIETEGFRGKLERGPDAAVLPLCQLGTQSYLPEAKLNAMQDELDALALGTITVGEFKIQEFAASANPNG